MKHLIQRSRRALALVLLCAPLAWAVTFNGMKIEVMPQLSFDTRSVQADAPAADKLVRSPSAGAYTLAARSVHSKGAITYASSKPAVATVEAATGRVTPLTVGETTITATQAAHGGFPVATARYTLGLSGRQALYQPWVLANRSVGAAPFKLGDTPPVSTPTHPSPFAYSSETPDVVTVTPEGIATVIKAGTATVVARQAATADLAAGEVRSSFLVTDGAAPPLQMPAREMRFGGSELALSGQVQGVTGDVTFVSSDNSVAEVGSNGLNVTARNVGNVTLSALQDNKVVATGALRVLKGTQTIGFSDQTVSNVNGPKVELQASASGQREVRFAVTGGDTAWVRLGADGKTLWLLWDTRGLFAHQGVMSVQITASLDETAQYEAASVTRTFKLENDPLEPPWIEFSQNLPGTVPTRPAAGTERYTARLRHNIAPSAGGLQAELFFKGFTSPNQDRLDPMRCRILSIKPSVSPEDEAVIEAEFPGGQGECMFRVWGEDGDRGNFVDYGTRVQPVTFVTSDMVIGPRPTITWPPITLRYGDAGVPAAPFPLPSIHYYVWNEGYNVISLPRPNLEDDNNPPFIYPIGIGTAKLYTYVGSPGGVAELSTTVTVLPTLPIIGGWSTPVSATVGRQQTLAAPFSSSTAGFTYRVEPPGLATFQNGTLTPLRAGEGKLVVEQAAQGNFDAASASRILTVHEAGAASFDFGAVERTYGDPAFFMQLPANAAVNPNEPYAVTTSTPNVVQVVPDGAALSLSILGAGSTDVVVTQATANGSVSIRGSVRVNKASPRLEYVALQRAELLQPYYSWQGAPACGTPYRVHFPLLNNGVFGSDQNGEATIKNARLSSLSSGGITYSTIYSDVFTFSAQSAYNKAAVYSMSLYVPNVGPEGVLLPLAIEQAETANYTSQRIVVPDAIRVYSTVPKGTALTCAV